MASSPPPGRTQFGASRGQTAPEQGFTPKKRKGDEGANSQRQKLSKYSAKLNWVVRELQQWGSDVAKGVAKGADYPSNAVIGPYNKAKPVLILTSSTNPKKKDDETAKLHDMFKSTFNLDSQSPELLVFAKGFSISYRAGSNFKTLNRSGDVVFDSNEVSGEDFTVNNLRKLLQEELKHLAITGVDAKKLFDFGKADATTGVAGLEFMTFSLRKSGKVRARWNGVGEAPDFPQIKDLVSESNKNWPLFTLIRKSQNVLPALDNDFKHRVRAVVVNGVLPFYNELANKVIGQQFKAWAQDPDKKLKHQPWMKVPGQDGAFERYVSHVAKTSFCNMREYETILSVALIQEVSYENECNAKYFSKERNLEAEVVQTNGNYIQVAVTVPQIANVASPAVAPGSRFVLRRASETVKGSESKEVDMNDAPAAASEDKGNDEASKDPSVDANGNTIMTEGEPLANRVADKPPTQRPIKDKYKQKAAEAAQRKAAAEASAPPKSPPQPSVATEEEENIKIAEDLSKFQMEDKDKFSQDPPAPSTQPAQTEAAPEKSESADGDIEMEGTAKKADRVWKAKAVAKDTTRSFIVSLTVKKEERKLFKMGSKLNITLEMKRNNLPSKRMLNAIGILADCESKKTPYTNYLKSFLLGDNMPQSPAPAPIADFKDGVKTMFQLFANSLNLNGPQQAFWESVFMTNKNVNILQGPPGTGKTKMDAACAVAFALLGQKVSINAPTNKACEAMMDAVIDDLEKIYGYDLALRAKIRLVLFPTTACFSAQLKDLEDMMRDASDMVDEGDTSASKRNYGPYMLWTHVINYHKCLTANTKAAEKDRKDAKEWLELLERIRAGEEIMPKVLRSFLKGAINASKKVVNDESVMIIISTNSNSAQLQSFGWQPNACILDESASGTEADSTVPLTLMAKHIILSGDHEQLKPLVKSTSFQEYFMQQGMSLFERVLRNGNVPVFRLRMNYRMHPDIALLPGMLSYGFLGCDEVTTVESDVFKYFKKFWNSKDAEIWRHARRDSKFVKGKRGESIRRLFFNVKGGRSAHPSEQSTSFVNFANANAIVDYVASLLGHYDSMTEEERKIHGSIEPWEITIITGYSEQKEVIEKLLKLVMESLGWTTFPQVVTIDSIQGGQNQVIILDLTAANEWHGAHIGFLGKWNRINVGATRAKQILSIFGNIDCWCSELETIVKEFHHKKFGYFMVDVLDGDVVDVELPQVERLLASKEELVAGEDSWSLQMPHMNQLESALKTAKMEKAAKTYKADKKAQEKFELNLYKNLCEMRKKRDELEKKFNAGEQVDFDVMDHDDDRQPDIGEGPDDEQPKDAEKTVNEQVDQALDGTSKDLVNDDDEFVDLNDPELIEQQRQAEQMLRDAQATAEAEQAHQLALAQQEQEDLERTRLEDEREVKEQMRREMEDQRQAGTYQGLGAAHPNSQQDDSTMTDTTRPFQPMGAYRHPAVIGQPFDGDLPDRTDGSRQPSTPQPQQGKKKDKKPTGRGGNSNRSTRSSKQKKMDENWRGPGGGAGGMTS